jgi:hypothetical protein
MIHARHTRTSAGDNLTIITLGEEPEWAARWSTLSGVGPYIGIVVIKTTAEFSEVVEFLSCHERTNFTFIALITTPLVASTCETHNLASLGWIIETEMENIEMATYAIATMFNGDSLVGFDFSDLRSVSGLRENAPGFGRAAVVYGLYDEDIKEMLQYQAKKMLDCGFSSGTALIHLVEETNSDMLDLQALDLVASEVFRQCGASRSLLSTFQRKMASAWVLVKFRS